MQQAQDARIGREDLGRRIVHLSFLALAAHLQQDRTRETARQQRKAGGAGRDESTDGWLSHLAEGDAA
jgi:hypothetical protein